MSSHNVSLTDFWNQRSIIKFDVQMNNDRILFTNDIARVKSYVRIRADISFTALNFGVFLLNIQLQYQW